MSSTPGPANDPDPASPLIKGQFLIAGKQMRDPNFYRSVVLMVEHGESGAMGLVVNRPSNVSGARALSEHFDLPESDQLVYVGGPVEPAGPCGPVAPSTPSEPTGPWGPVAPSAPSEPSAPAGPVGPAGPWRPVAPSAPAGPSGPTSPELGPTHSPRELITGIPCTQ